MILAALVYWTIVFSGVFLAVLLGFTVLDWILDR